MMIKGITMTIYIYIYIYSITLYTVTLHYNPTSTHNITTISQGPTVTAKQQRGALLLKELANTLEAHGQLPSHLSRRRKAVEDRYTAGFKVGKHGKMMMKDIKIGKIGTYFLDFLGTNMWEHVDYPRANVQKETRQKLPCFPLLKLHIFSNFPTPSAGKKKKHGAPGNGFSMIQLTPNWSTLWTSEKNWIQLDG